jgi:hypothetical protein
LLIFTVLTKEEEYTEEEDSFSKDIISNNVSEPSKPI